MPTESRPAFDELVERLVQSAQENLPPAQAQRAISFLEQYYRRVPAEDLAQTALLDLYGGALAHLNLALERKPAAAIVRVYNPDFETHGWHSSHTVVEIVVDDTAFLVDSISMALNRLGYTIHLTVHPVIEVSRDQTGRLEAPGEPGTTALAESYIQCQIDHQSNLQTLKSTKRTIEQVIGEVVRAASDWQAMRGRALEAVQPGNGFPAAVSHEAIEEAVALCRWIADDLFTFLGSIVFDVAPGDPEQLVPQPDTALGILRPAAETDLADRLAVLPVGMPGYLEGHEPLLITKANKRSNVHRPAYMDIIAVRHFDTAGTVTGETCLLGLFSAGAYNRAVTEVPALRLKLRRLLERSGLPANGHGIKVLQNIVENYPRDDLFQVTEDELFSSAMGILELQERQRVRLFSRRDRFGRFYSCLVFVPRDHFNSDLRLRIGEILLDACNGRSLQFNVYFSESVLARIHYLISVDPDSEPRQELRLVEKRIAQAARSWDDDLKAALVAHFGEEPGLAHRSAWGGGFSAAYQADCSARQAAYDIPRIADAAEKQHLGILLYRGSGTQNTEAQLKLFSPGNPVVLSDVLPMIENMGLRVVSERPYRVMASDGAAVWIHIFNLLEGNGLSIDVDARKHDFEQVFQSVWDGEADNDGFNRLVLRAGLNWRETTLLRALYRYLRQIQFRYSQDYVIDTLAGNPRMTARIVSLFHARFDPDIDADRAGLLVSAQHEITVGLERVANLDEDRILFGFFNLVESIVRTNYYQEHDDTQPARLSIKIESQALARMPAPRPLYEIFVYSPRVEAIHLRAGKVARGGLRWSDRPEDFRTEVLGLVKAQIVKNAVIVPVGSKGGFIVRKPALGAQEAEANAAVDCYRTFIRGMLDITDNRKGDTIIPPERVVRHDDDDPYLVVAADKGTATFSDIANAVAAEYGYWLGDAFASGGSAGYDHKAMGITARGAWESVKRLFRELGIDTQATPFTVVGIGDMSGDVFGNGMLLSQHIRLVGAFNHQHVFIDPDPDPATSYAERNRLFHLAHSSWDDYDRETISPGGGVWPRSAKFIDLSEQARKALGISAARLSPSELIHEMLKAPVDLLWNGGIGTYVKASTESHEDARDRVNDALRVDANTLRCRVIGEGGNLGVTQLGRIEFSRGGGLCHTDAIDNSAGVDTSDHEVNIKILLNAAVETGEINIDERNSLLEEMTEEIARLVLHDNYAQTQALALAADGAAALIHQHGRALRQMERGHGLDRALEFLPDEETLAERSARGEGLARPELAVLLAYSKITTYQILLDSDVPEDPFLAEDLLRYFPARLSERFGSAMTQHRLRREIIATYVTNSMINRVGPGFTLRMSELTGRPPPDTARAYTAIREIFRLRELWFDIEALDNKVSAALQLALLHDTGQLLERGITWLLHHQPGHIDIAQTVESYRDGVDTLRQGLPRVLAASNRLTQKRRVRRFLNAGVPADLANRAAALAALSSALDIVDVAATRAHDVAAVAAVYFDVGDRLGLHWLRGRIRELPVTSHWHSMARFSLRAELNLSQRDLAARVLDNGQGQGKAAVRHWVTAQQSACNRYLQLVNDLRRANTRDFAMLSVAVSEAHRLADTTTA